MMTMMTMMMMMNSLCAYWRRESAADNSFALNRDLVELLSRPDAGSLFPAL